jgi:hypothetical protein
MNQFANCQAKYIQELYNIYFQQQLLLNLLNQLDITSSLLYSSIVGMQMMFKQEYEMTPSQLTDPVPNITQNYNTTLDQQSNAQKLNLTKTAEKDPKTGPIKNFQLEKPNNEISQNIHNLQSNMEAQTGTVQGKQSGLLKVVNPYYQSFSNEDQKQLEKNAKRFC